MSGSTSNEEGDRKNCVRDHVDHEVNVLKWRLFAVEYREVVDQPARIGQRLCNECEAWWREEKSGEQRREEKRRGDKRREERGRREREGEKEEEKEEESEKSKREEEKTKKESEKETP